MGISFTGLSSGLNTADLVKQLIAVESIPQQQLQAKAKTERSEISALQDLNTRVAALAKLAKELTAGDALALFTAKGSSDAVSVAARAGAAPGSVDVVVDAVATAQKSVTATLATAPTTRFTLTDAAGERTELTAASTSLDDVVTAINRADAGVTAVKVAAGTDAATGEKLYRLQLTGTATGASGAFSFHAGTAAEVDAGTATNLLAAPGAATVTAAADSVVRLWAGTAAEQTVTSASTTFTDLLPGVDVTVSKASADPVTVTVGEDPEARANKVRSLVDAVSAILARIGTQTKVTIGSDGSTSGATLAGESIVRNARQSLLGAVTDPVDGASLSSIGIEITRYGEVTFDAEKLSEALAADPDRTMSTFTQVATRVQKTADMLSDKYDGLLTTSVKNRETQVTRLDDQIARWDQRLEQRFKRLTAQYTVMEVQLAKLDSQQQWLTGQLATLMPSSSSKR
ncbi:flagellar filament capping protein FliD [Cellulosimicrobium sp. TH-20]|uniref:flagellar filament capping protein FliD n=1 Tax=unclassified Cellulosimicrobium TaxID=2624466 RepID=UPI001649F5B8